MEILNSAEDMKKSGVYKITCKVNGKIYIGSSKNMHIRYNEHMSDFKIGRNSPRMQNSWNKYGDENFTFEILETCEREKNIILEKEQFYLDKFESYDRNIGFNICPKAESTLGTRWTEKQKKKIQKIRAKILGSEFKIQSPDGTIYTGKGYRQFARSHNIPEEIFRELMRGCRIEYNGWRNPEKTYYTEEKTWKFLDPWGKEIILKGYKEYQKFRKENNLDRKILEKVTKGEFRQHRGFSRFDGQDNYITFISPNNEEITFNRYRRTAFCEKFNLKSDLISHVLAGICETTQGGWKLKK